MHGTQAVVAITHLEDRLKKLMEQRELRPLDDKINRVRSQRRRGPRVRAPTCALHDWVPRTDGRVGEWVSRGRRLSSLPAQEMRRRREEIRELELKQWKLNSAIERRTRPGATVRQGSAVGAHRDCDCAGPAVMR